MTIAEDSARDGPNTIPGFPNTRPQSPIATPLPEAPAGALESRDGSWLKFSGDGAEYFKIWAVNLALTIITLGIYSAWAKVRRLRYFYGNTTLQGSTFDFHGRPVAILRGRIVALVLLVLYTQSAKFSLTLFAITIVFIAAIFPWIFYRSLRFRLGNTSYRGVRFQFGGTVAGAYALFVPAILLVLGPNFLFVATIVPGAKPDLRAMGPLFLLYLVLLAYWPYFLHRLRCYQHGQAFFGSSQFGYSGSAGMFYVLVLKCLAFSMVGSFVMGIFVGALSAYVGFSNKGAPISPAHLMAIIYPVIALFYAGMLAIIPFWTSRSQNIVWNNTLLNETACRSNLPFKRLFWIEAQNFLLTIVTLGIFRPFAAVRSARLRLEAVRYAGDVGAFGAAAASAGGATGAEFVEMFGFDISL